MPDPAHENSYQKAIKQTLDDPLVKILVQGSNLTSIQFQTFLIDHILYQRSSEGAENALKNYTRVDKPRITRGSFNRTLTQATRNIIRAIYTVFLLGYVGIFDTPALDPFIETSRKVSSYVDGLRLGGAHVGDVNAQAVVTLSQELRKAIENLAGARRFRNL